MSVAEYGESVGTKIAYRFDGLHERLGALVRESVDQVQVQRRKSKFSNPLNDLADKLFIVYAIYGLLNNRIEVLYPDRSPIETNVMKRCYVFAGEPTWIHFTTDFRCARNIE